MAYKSIKYLLCSFICSGEVSETWIEIIDNTVQFIPQVAMGRANTQKVDLIFHTVAQFIKSLRVRGDGTQLMALVVAHP